MNHELRFKVVFNGEVSRNSFTIGDFIEGKQIDFKDGAYLMFNDIEWGKDKVKYIQYIGLRDKNKKRIYDGDILAWVKGEAPFELYLIKYVAPSFVWQFFRAGKWNKITEPICDMHEFEVIGNIYENPKPSKD